MSDSASTTHDSAPSEYAEPRLVAGHSGTSASEPHPVPDLVDYITDYARQKPEVAAMWCFGVGFVLGWKLKPW